MPTTTRTFRVFVSSTFEDLEEERNALQERVFPKLEQFCLEKGARFQAIDLRWGVREEAGLDQKTIEICLAEIARCQKTEIKPNFIVLLGNRYGWRPLPARIPKHEFEAVVVHIVQAGERDFVQSWYDLDLNAEPPEYLLKPRKAIYSEWEVEELRIHRALRDGAQAAGLHEEDLTKYEASATHQEILKGLGDSVEDRKYVFAFFREQQGSEDPDLTKLKDHLRSELPKENIFAFLRGDHAQLCNDVEGSLTTVIAATAELFEAENEKSSQGQFARDRAKHFIGREVVLNAIERYLGSYDQRPLLVYGPSGSGKSAIMAVASSKEKNAICRFIGVTPDSSSGVSLLRSLCRELGERFGQMTDVPATFNELSRAFSNHLRLATAEQPLILFIDALDQLSTRDPAAVTRWIPTELPPYCRLVVSTTEIPATLPSAAMVPVELLTAEEAGLALNAWFTEVRRTLQPEQREKLLTSFLRCGLPLYLKLAFEEARLWRSFDHLDKCVLGDGLPGIIDRLFARLSDRTNHGPVLVGHALGYLSAARYGLTEDEILAVLTNDDIVWNDVVGEGRRRRHSPPLRQLPIIVWSRLFLDLEPYLTERIVPGGTTISFYHKQLADRVKTSQSHHNALASHFAEQSLWLGANVPNQRKLTELVRQQAGARLLDDMETVLTDLDYVSAKCAAELVFDLEEDYRQAIAALPEAERALAEEENRKVQAARWTATLVQCAEQKRSPTKDELPESIRLWSNEDINIEIRRITQNPDRLDRLRAFAGFVERELYPLVECGAHPGFVAQHGFNFAPAGPIHEAARALKTSVAGPFFSKRWRTSAGYQPKPALVRTLDGHTFPVKAVSMTPDGRRAVSADFKGLLKVWDLESGACLHTLEGHEQDKQSVSITPDGCRAASSSGGTLRVWDLESGECLLTRENSILSVAITADGQRIISGSFDGTLRVWNVESGECQQTLECQSGITSISVVADGRRAVSASWDGTVRMWDLESGACRDQAEDGSALAISVTPEGRRAVSGYDNGQVLVWDVATQSRMLHGHTLRIVGVSITPDGRRAVSASWDWSIRVWDLESGTCQRVLEGHTSLVMAVSVSADGRRAVSASADKTVRVWDLESGANAKLEEHDWGIRSLSITEDGRRAVSGSAGGTLHVWDLESGACLATRDIPTDSVTSLSVSMTPDGRRAVSAFGGCEVRVWEMDSVTCEQILRRGNSGDSRVRGQDFNTFWGVSVTKDGRQWQPVLMIG